MKRTSLVKPEESLCNIELKSEQMRAQLYIDKVNLEDKERRTDLYADKRSGT